MKASTMTFIVLLLGYLFIHFGKTLSQNDILQTFLNEHKTLALTF